LIPAKLNVNLIESREIGKDLWVVRWVRNNSDRGAVCSGLNCTRPTINEVTDMLDRRTSLTTPTTLSEKAAHDISQALLPLLSDVFALYLKTKNFHWHMSGPHFRDYHLMLDDQGEADFSNDGRHC